MDEFGCDYECRTVGESITKYSVPDDWYAEFDVYDGAYPIISIQVDQIRKAPAMMALKLRIVEDPDNEYAGCILSKGTKIITFKINFMSDLKRAIALGTKQI